MTESEWLGCADPEPMLRFLRGKAMGRKLRLLALAFCDRISPLLTDGRCLNALKVVARYADGNASDDELFATNRDAEMARVDVEAIWLRAPDEAKVGAYRSFQAAMAVYEATFCSANAERSDPMITAAYAAYCAAEARFPSKYGDALTDEPVQALLVREVFGNPFRPVLVCSEWVQPKVFALGRMIYDNETFERMPELAEALEQAGCTSSDILDHCRGPGPHVKGCWVLDLLLGRQ